MTDLSELTYDELKAYYTHLVELAQDTGIFNACQQVAQFLGQFYQIPHRFGTTCLVWTHPHPSRPELVKVSYSVLPGPYNSAKKQYDNKLLTCVCIGQPPNPFTGLKVLHHCGNTPPDTWLYLPGEWEYCVTQEAIYQAQAQRQTIETAETDAARKKLLKLLLDGEKI